MSNWIKVPSKSHPDRYYYFNTVTKKSSWINPHKNSKESALVKDESSEMRVVKKAKMESSSDNLVPVEITNVNQRLLPYRRVIKAVRRKKNASSFTLANNNVKEGANRHHSMDQSSSSYGCTESMQGSIAKEINSSQQKKSRDLKHMRCASSDKNSHGDLLCHGMSTGGSSESSWNSLSLKPTSGGKNNEIYTNTSHSRSKRNEKIEMIENPAFESRLKLKNAINGKKESGKTSLKDNKVSLDFERSSTSSGKNPAQLRLLRKREEYVSMIKKQHKSLEVKKHARKDMGSSSGDRKHSNVKVGDALREEILNDNKFLDGTDILNHNNSSSTSQIFYQSEINTMEAMDWEPLEQETVIEHINWIRKNVTVQQELSEDIVMRSIKVDEELNNGEGFILVFDTNVFISSLSFIAQIRDTFVPDLGLPFIFIPWRILQELDNLKVSQKGQLRVCARKAIGFINDSFSSQHPRVGGQSFDEFLSMKNEKCTVPDDEILHVCLNLKTRCEKIVLVTNDKNLESKAVVSKIECYSKERFQQKVLRDDVQNEFCKNPSYEKVTAKAKNDVLFCKLKYILEEFLKLLLETELRIAYNDDWIQMIRKKPPWSLRDIIECFIDHWRSVFTFVFRRNILTLMKELKLYVTKWETGVESEVVETVKISIILLNSMRDAKNNEKPYVKLLSSTISNLEELIETEGKQCQRRIMKESDETSSPASSSMTKDESQVTESGLMTAADRVVCKEKVKNLLSIIWGHIKNFCDRVKDLANSDNMNDCSSLDEVKSQFPHVMRNVQELITIAEGVLSLSPDSINQERQIILHFTNFLIQLNVIQLDSSELNNFPIYVGTCCEDIEGRVGTMRNGVGRGRERI